MKTILAPRASTILYDVLVDRAGTGTFLLPANICPIVPITLFRAGVPIEFVDISPDTLNLDLGEVETRLEGRISSYGGLLYAHTYGDPSTPVEFIQELKTRFPDLLVIDDRCLCVPDLDPKESSTADVTLYSTGYAKIVDIGFGGYAFVRDDVPCARHRLPFDHGDLVALEAGYKDCIESGGVYSYRESNWLQTDADLPSWPDFRRRVMDAMQPSLDRRRAINAVYNSRIPSELQLPEPYQLWRFSLRLPRKQQVLEAIFAAGLFASSHYASLDGIMGGGGGQNARELAGRVINLFNDHHYTLDMAERTAEIVLRSL